MHLVHGSGAQACNSSDAAGAPGHALCGSRQQPSCWCRCAATQVLYPVQPRAAPTAWLGCSCCLAASIHSLDGSGRLPAAGAWRQQRRRLAGAAQALQAAPIARPQRAEGLQLPAGGPRPLTRAAGHWPWGDDGCEPPAASWPANRPHRTADSRSPGLHAALGAGLRRASGDRRLLGESGLHPAASCWVGGASAEETGGGQAGAPAKIACLTCSLHEVRGSPGGPCKLSHCLQKLRGRFDGIQRRAPPLL